MDTVTLVQSTIRGSVAGKMINCAVHTAPAGLKLPAGRYFLYPAETNPVYGPVMSLEPIPPGGSAPAAHKATVVGTEKTMVYLKTPAIKIAPDAPSSVKSPPPAGVKMAPAIKFDAPAIDKWKAPASKGYAPAIKFDAPSAKAEVPGGESDAPSSPKDSANRGFGTIVVASRAIAGNCLVITSGFADLIDAVQRAGGITLIVT
jgi:hypothetical protein